MTSTLLLAESGATKTDWRLLTPTDELWRHTSGGLNAAVMGLDAVRRALEVELMPLMQDKTVGRVVFYGPSLGNADLRRGMADLLKTLTGVADVAAEHDLLAAARATAGREPGVVCILGTGSNSGRYDGRGFTATRGGHGYLMGDEGSAADIGRRLLKAFLDDELPDELRAPFEAETGNSILAWRAEVYRAQRPNALLASFAPFVSAHLQRSELLELLRTAFKDFIEKTILRYDYQNLSTHFVGSVAEALKPTLLSVCRPYHINVGVIVGQPIDRLAHYHQHYGFND